MTCREFIEFLMEYLLGEVDREKFDAHLAVCPSCVNYLKTYQHTIKASKAALADLDESLPKDAPEELVQAILASRRKPR
jgi:anti-sigma factor RsiW